MQNQELLQDGLALMALGMGVVFVFLTLLVISVTLMSKLIGRFQPAPVPVEAGRKSPPPAAPTEKDEVMAVISAAVHRYRSTRRR
ncbi:OadG family protein [Vreelandella maris]|uniref:OadG family protein n=1 Tax=Vreelandella maris TaxID=2729617 RepID=UPI0030EC2CAD|tara:strand:- start:61558 stop:61812 length:255 start_codon:yes stop_codon:yes gene_type:complete